MFKVFPVEKVSLIIDSKSFIFDVNRFLDLY